MFRIVWQVWIGEIGKIRLPKCLRNKKKQIANDRFYKEFGI